MCYLSLNAGEELDRVLRDLEKLQPDSCVFQALDRQPEDASYQETMARRVDDLTRRAFSGGADAPGALAALRELVQQYPTNESYRSPLMFAEGANGNMGEALRHADALERMPGGSHERYFNIAQIFYRAGDPARGEANFDRAYQLARDDQERRDVDEERDQLRGSYGP